MPNSNKVDDACGVCGGDGSTCAGCDGVPHHDPKDRARPDVCGVCAGNGSTCADCDGVPNGPNPPDVCGVCGGNGTSCLDCNGCPNGPDRIDACNVCGGDNSTCAGCDGVPQIDPELRAKKDVCGVCNGDNTSCQDKWCDPDIPGSTFDACNVCAGDNSTCTCVAYRNRTVAQLDCVLLEWTLTNTVSAIDEQLALLATTNGKLNDVDLGSLNEFIGAQIRQLNSFVTECSEVYCDTLSSLVGELASSFSLSSTPSRRSSVITSDSSSRFASL
jgi:hypothetical protein